MDETPDVPLDNFGADTEVAAPPAAEPTEPSSEGEQTTQPVEANGSEDATEGQPEQTNDNPIADNQESAGRPEKRDRLQSRFGELTGKLKQQDEYIQQLEAQFNRNQALGQVQPLQPDEDGQVDLAQLQQYQSQQAQAIAQAEVSNLRTQLEREAIANRFDTAGNQIEKTLEIEGLTNPVHAEKIQKAIERQVQFAQYNVNSLKQIDPIEIANDYIEGVKAERRFAQTRTAQNLQETQASQGVTPDTAPQGIDPNSQEAIEARVSEIKF